MRCVMMVSGSAGWLVVAFLLGGCWADVANLQLRTVPQVTEDVAIGTVYVGPFLDMRQGGKVDTTILGTIRGGVGNPVARIRHAGGGGEFVREQVINAARACQIVADRTPDAVGVRREGGVWALENRGAADRLILAGFINQLTVETGTTKGTVIDLSIELIDPTRTETQRVWNSVVVDAQRATTFEVPNPTDLKQWLGESLEKATAKALSSPDFATALKQRR